MHTRTHLNTHIHIRADIHTPHANGWECGVCTFASSGARWKRSSRCKCLSRRAACTNFRYRRARVLCGMSSSCPFSLAPFLGPSPVFRFYVFRASFLSSPLLRFLPSAPPAPSSPHSFLPPPLLSHLCLLPLPSLSAFSPLPPASPATANQESEDKTRTKAHQTLTTLRDWHEEYFAHAAPSNQEAEQYFLA